jgi:PTS system ascorbate-specific IIA component
MIRIVLLAHSPLASALKAVASHVFPECAGGVEAVDVDPSADAQAVEALLRTLLGRGEGQETLILVDAFGATPCNAAMKAADGVRVRVVAGVNVPMLWRTLCYRHESIDAIVQRAVAGAVQGVMQVSDPRRQNQSSVAGSTTHDQVEHSHQQ